MKQQPFTARQSVSSNKKNIPQQEKSRAKTSFYENVNPLQAMLQLFTKNDIVQRFLLAKSVSLKEEKGKLYSNNISQVKPNHEEKTTLSNGDGIEKAVKISFLQGSALAFLVLAQLAKNEANQVKSKERKKSEENRKKNETNENVRGSAQRAVNEDACSTLVVVLPTVDEARKLAFNLQSLQNSLGAVKGETKGLAFDVLLLEGESTLPYSFSLASPVYVQNLQRFYSLAFKNSNATKFENKQAKNIDSHAVKGKSDCTSTVVITHATFVAQPFETYAAVRKKAFTLQVGENIPASVLRSKLAAAGYGRVMRVEAPGEYANRGELFDLFTPASTSPLRLYFFGDELEEIRLFSSKSQSSFPNKKLSSITVMPFLSLCENAGGLKSAANKAAKLIENLSEVTNLGNVANDSALGANTATLQALLQQFQEIVLSYNAMEVEENYHLVSQRKHFFPWESFGSWLTHMKASLWVVQETEILQELKSLQAAYLQERNSLLYPTFSSALPEQEENLKNTSVATENKLSKIMDTFISPAEDVLCTWQQALSIGIKNSKECSKHDGDGDTHFSEKNEVEIKFIEDSVLQKDSESNDDGDIDESIAQSFLKNYHRAIKENYRLPIMSVPLFKKQLSKAKEAVQFRLQQGAAVCLLTSNAFARTKLESIFAGETPAEMLQTPTSILKQAKLPSHLVKELLQAERSEEDSLLHSQTLLGKQAFVSASKVAVENAVHEVGLQSRFYISHSLLSSGFAFAGLHLFTDYEMFGKSKSIAKISSEDSFDEVVGTIESEESEESEEEEKKQLATQSASMWLDSYFDLTENGFVVHQLHGIGVFRGLQQLTVEDSHKDYLKIEYADKSFLFVPVEQLSLVQKYVGGVAKMDRLGGKAWEKLKKRVAENTAKLAKQLVRLYGQRAHLSTTPFLHDDFFQSDFEMQFPFAETKDQLHAVSEIKADLESESVMDRLLCADVGFGKTEVALRAVFKAVLSGFQVAFLVPTTILSQQHYRNFLQRFEDYPVHFELLNRHVKTKEKQQIHESLTSGKTDVVVSTHKLFSKQIKFKRLGLLVIDEEQKFGVKQKEALKEKYPYVNTLALSATPIPRTLHMSLSGVRKLSVISTPPHGRKAVDVYTMQTSTTAIRRAALQEKMRGGQIFFVCPRIKTLEVEASVLQKLLPEFSIAVAHGQMEEKEINGVMERFVSGEVDVLCATAIVESGLDIPNANTLIVMNSQRFGLSQLYQLKGRVGRSQRQASAYFFYPNAAALRGNAKKRLESLSESTHIGAGFSLAMRDMEIRGAGNLLGPQQSGSIAEVGYEMYCRLLAQSIASQTNLVSVSGKAATAAKTHTFKDDVIDEPVMSVKSTLFDEIQFEREEREENGETNEDERGNISAFASLPTSVDIKYDGVLEDDYAGGTTEKIKLFRQIAATEKMEELEKLTSDILDRFGPLPAPIEKLISIAKLRIVASSVGVLSVTERSEYFEITFNLVSQFWLRHSALWHSALQANKRVHFLPEKKDCVRLSKLGLMSKANFKKASTSQKKIMLEQFFVNKMAMLQKFFTLSTS